MNKIILIFLFFILINACNTEKKNEPIAIKHPSPKELIDSFYHYKKLYLLEDERYFGQLQGKWNEIVLNRDSVLPFLLCSGFKNDSSTSLYGDNYPELPNDDNYTMMMFPKNSRFPTIVPENYMIEKIPNYIHALYLVEAIIHNNYLFNRRFNAEYLTHPKEFLYHDGINFVYNPDSTDMILKLGYKISFSYKREDKNKIWLIYSIWFKSYSSNKPLGSSPLKNTGYHWYNRNIDIKGSSVSPNIIYSTNENVIKAYRLDYKIGNGWMPPEIRK